MTFTELNKASKQATIEYITQLQESHKAEMQNATNIANYFSSVILNIETVIQKSPFINKEGKIFKKLFWVVSNFETIKILIEEIVAHIKAWRNQVEELVTQQKVAKNSSKLEESTVA